MHPCNGRRMSDETLFLACLALDTLEDGTPFVVKRSVSACVSKSEVETCLSVYEMAGHKYRVTVGKRLGGPILALTIMKHDENPKDDCCSVIFAVIEWLLRGDCDEAIIDRLNYEADMRSDADVN